MRRTYAKKEEGEAAFKRIPFGNQQVLIVDKEDVNEGVSPP